MRASRLSAAWVLAFCAITLSLLAEDTTDSDYTFSTLAGFPLDYGRVDGVGVDARFGFLSYLCINTSNEIFVLETWQPGMRKISRTGVVTTLPEISPQWSTNNPSGFVGDITAIASDFHGNLILADGGQKPFWRLDAQGALEKLKVDPIYYSDLEMKTNWAWVFTPRNLAVDIEGNIYATSSNWDMIWKINPDGSTTNLAGSYSSGFSDGIGSYARFKSPAGIAVDKQGIVYVADTGNHVIRRITPEGATTTLAGSPEYKGYADGQGSAARFNKPTGVAVDSAGNVFVADTDNSVIRRITPLGEVTTVAGANPLTSTHSWPAFYDGTGRKALFSRPEHLAIDTEDNLYVTDAETRAIRKGWLATPEKRVLIERIFTNDWFAVSSKSNVSFGISVESDEPVSFAWMQGVIEPVADWWLRKYAWRRSRHTNAIVELDHPRSSDQGVYLPVVISPLGNFIQDQIFIRVYSPQVLTSVTRQTDGRVRIKFQDEHGDIAEGNFKLQWRSTLSPESTEEWQDVPGMNNPPAFPYQVEDGYLVWEDVTAIGQPQRFYRVIED